MAEEEQGVARYVAAEGHIWKLGDSFLVEAFFATVSGQLERGNPGGRFPTLGRLATRRVADAPRLRRELAEVKEEFQRLSPRFLVWSFAGPAPRRPWTLGRDNLALCFVSDDGPDLFLALELAAGYAVKHGQFVEII